MTTSRARKALYTGLAAIGITAGAAGVANAATSGGSNSTTAASQHVADRPEPGDTADNANDAADSPSYTGSVTVPNGGADNGAENDAAESAQLAALAKISPAQASQAALAAVPGTAAAPVLENENGSVVYGVAVTTANGVIDVKVDAGNGKVLAQDRGDANEKEGAETRGANDTETNDTPGTANNR